MEYSSALERKAIQMQEPPYGRSLEESGSQRQKAAGWMPGTGGRVGGLVLNGDRASEWENEKVLDTATAVEKVKFTLRVFYHH